MPDTDRRDVSVVVCCYNHAPYVEQCLDSILGQTLQPSQLVITDDCSSDDTAGVVARWIERHRPDAQLVRNETNLGLPATLNRAVPLLTGELVVMISADDWMVEDRLERQVATFDASSPSVGMVYSDMVEVDQRGTPTGQRWFDPDRMGPCPGSGDLFEPMLRRACMAAPTVMIRTELLQQAGPYDTSLVAEDYDMFLRLSRRAEWAFLDHPTVFYRVLDSSLSRSTAFLGRYRAGRMRLLRKHLGVSRSTDLVIADRLALMGVSLYHEGRSPAETRQDLWASLRIRFRPRTLAFLVPATLGVPGPTVVRMGAPLRRLRSLRPGRRGPAT